MAAKHLVRHLLVGVGALADGIVAPLALVAFAADGARQLQCPVVTRQLTLSTAEDRERHDHAVADLPRLVIAPRFDGFAHELVPQDVAAFVGMNVKQVQVRAADRAGRDLDDRVAAVFGLRVRYGVATDVVLAMAT